VIVHAIVSDFVSARRAVDAGATVVQLRLKGASTGELVAVGGAFGPLGATFVVDDDVEAALALGADGVHLGQDADGAERAHEAGLLLGLSVANRREAAIAEYRGAGYLGAGAIWAAPSKPDAPALGLDVLPEIVCPSACR
jgi:thiamine-phosphate pyrophosphorylase